MWSNFPSPVSWAGKPEEFSEIYSKSIEQEKPKSLFVVTVIDKHSNSLFMVSLTSQIYGDKKDHDAQLKLMESEKKSFNETLSKFNWIKQP